MGFYESTPLTYLQAVQLPLSGSMLVFPTKNEPDCPMNGSEDTSQPKNMLTKCNDVGVGLQYLEQPPFIWNCAI